MLERRVTISIFLVFVALCAGAGSCDSPTRSRGPRKPACWKAIVDTTGEGIRADHIPVWSTSGNLIAYVSAFDSCNNPYGGIYVTDLTSIPKDRLDIFGVHYRWLPGDSEMLVNTGLFFGGQLMKYNLASQTITDLEISTDRLQFDVSKDGNLVYYENGWIIEHDLRTGVERQLVQIGGGPAISPDGSKLAYAVGSINVFDLVDGTTRVLVAEGIHPTWTPDGNHVVYYHSTENEIHKVDSLGNITILSPGLGAPSVSPDGQTVLFPWSQNNVTHIWRVGIDGTGLRQFTR